MTINGRKLEQRANAGDLKAISILEPPKKSLCPRCRRLIAVVQYEQGPQLATHGTYVLGKGGGFRKCTGSQRRVR